MILNFSAVLSFASQSSLIIRNRINAEIRKFIFCNSDPCTGSRPVNLYVVAYVIVCDIIMNIAATRLQ